MTQRAYRAACPACGAPVEFKSAASAFAVCGYCRSTVVRKGDALERMGTMAELFDDHTALQLGAAGKVPADASIQAHGDLFARDVSSGGSVLSVSGLRVIARNPVGLPEEPHVHPHPRLVWRRCPFPRAGFGCIVKGRLLRPGKAVSEHPNLLSDGAMPRGTGTKACVTGRGREAKGSRHPSIPRIPA